MENVEMKGNSSGLFHFSNSSFFPPTATGLCGICINKNTQCRRQHENPPLSPARAIIVIRSLVILDNGVRGGGSLASDLILDLMRMNFKQVSPDRYPAIVPNKNHSRDTVR